MIDLEQLMAIKRPPDGIIQVTLGSRVAFVRTKVGGGIWCETCGDPGETAMAVLLRHEHAAPTRSHCKRGHELTDENCYFQASGKRR